MEFVCHDGQLNEMVCFLSKEIAWRNRDPVSGYVELFEVVLFGLEMRCCILNQTIDDLAQNILALALPHGVIEFVNHDNQFLMLFVDFCNLDAEAVIPLD
jgi:hypothetical protein